MKEASATYHSYLLRLWQDSPHSHWHASVQSVQTRDVIRFADLEALISFLWGQTLACPTPPHIEEGASGWTEEDHSARPSPFPPALGEG